MPAVTLPVIPKRILAVIMALAAFAAVAPLACSGCGGVKPGSDRLVVGAETAAQVALDTVNEFLMVESENYDYLKPNAPAVVAVANQLRRDFPPAFRQFRTITNTYKGSRTLADADKVEDALEKLETLARLARNAMLKTTTQETQ